VLPFSEHCESSDSRILADFSNPAIIANMRWGVS